jgi:hypothetical protein
MTEIIVRGIAERDIDLLLLEEFVANADFREWFLGEVGLTNPQDLILAARSVPTSTGESDLELTLDDHGWLTKVLIENKIDAILQPGQAERYAERAAGYLSSATCQQVMTVLISPKAYTGTLAGFDQRVTYEAIQEWLEGNLEEDGRGPYKLFLLRAALDRGTAGWTLVPDETATEFWRRYWKLASKVAPELRMRRPGAKPATSGFIYFKPAGLPRGVDLIHKAPYGHVDLQLRGKAEIADEFEKTHGPHLEPDMEIERAHKSLVVRISIPRVKLKTPFDESEATVQEGLRAARRLLAWHSRWLRPSRLNPGGERT